jgi:glycosyltransferase involved in cell wall biosynthesis
VRSADGVTCVSAPLARKIREEYGYAGRVEVIENAIPPGLFVPADKAECRRQFGLPADSILIGTAGALSGTRGTGTLLQAFDQLARQRNEAHLVLAGPVDSDLAIPASDRIHYLGMLEPTAVPKLLSALDISVVSNRDSAFGRYCFPQKLYESIACGVPVAVARVGAMAELLRDFPDNLYEAEDVDSLLATLQGLCRAPVLPNLEIATWPMLGERLLRFLQPIAERKA